MCVVVCETRSVPLWLFTVFSTHLFISQVVFIVLLVLVRLIAIKIFNRSAALLSLLLGYAGLELLVDRNAALAVELNADTLQVKSFSVRTTSNTHQQHIAVQL